MRKYGAPPASPDRSRPWAEPPPLKQQQQQQRGRKIPVVYYLCRNRHLEHPHFIEVPLSSPDGLYLRDVIDRMNVLRGKGMPAIYSWSCKRSYKSGFVWHDLSEDDLILPVHGNEYVLKGSELMDQSPPDRSHGAANLKQQNPNAKLQETPTCSRIHAASSSSSPTIFIKESKTPPSPIYQLQDTEHSPAAHSRGFSGDASPEAGRLRLYENGSPGSAEYRVYKPLGAADASTQTDEGEGRTSRGCDRDTCTRGVSTDEGGSFELDEHRASANEISPPPTSSSASSSAGKTETLESLIRAEASKINSFRILEEEDVFVPAATKMKAANVLMQLITCGSISVKDHCSFGLIPAYRPRFTQMRFPSPMLTGSVMMGELNCLSDNPRLMALRMADKEYFSGSLIETKKHMEEAGEGAAPTLKRSSSYNADRICKSPEPERVKDKVVDSSRSKCLPRTIKITSTRPSRNEAMRSPVADCPRKSSAGTDCSRSPKGGSKRFTDVSSAKGSSTRLGSFNEEKEKVIRTEES